MSTTLKVYFTLPTGKQEIRRFTTTEKLVLPALLNFLETTYSKTFQPPLRFLIQYDDGEDLLTVSSEVELQEGLALNPAGSVMKLLVRFDDSPVSVLNTPSASGMSTPSVAPSTASSSTVIEHPPSPSMARMDSSMVRVDEPVVEEKPSNDKSSLLASKSPRSDEEAVDVMVSSDDEYVRIEDDEEASTSTSTSAPLSPEEFIEEKAANRFACRLCPKLFRGRNFVAEHIKNKHADALVGKKTVKTESTGTATTPTASTENATQTTSTAAETIPTQTDAPNETSISTQTEPKVDESSATKSPSVEISDVTGHHDHTASPTEQDNKAAAPVVHHGITCDGCQMSPIVGDRFHCTTCLVPGGFDLCAICEARGDKHPPSHVLTKLSTPEEETASATPSAHTKATGEVVHRGITCDGCQMSPIVGHRYHCTTCLVPGGFDLCSACEASGDKHPSTHVLLKMRTPAHIPVGSVHRHFHCPRRMGGVAMSTGPRPKAAFISDVNLADGVSVHAGETLTKIWSIKNIGEQPWPHGTRLVFAGGDLAPESEGVTDPFGACVPFAGPGDVVHVSLSIQVPNETGRFRGTFRLEAPDGTRFGPRIWLDLVVPEESASSSSTPKESTSTDKAIGPSKVEEPKQQSAATTPVSSASSSSSAAASAPSPRALPAIPTVESKEQEAAAVASAFAASHAAAAAEAARRQPSFQYANQLATLRSMGFKDQELCRYLLLNNGGDIQKCVTWLLNNASA